MCNPNILLIQTDQQTAETLALYGNSLVKTPHLEGLAENGVLFENAFCNYPACSPSRSSMMTGRYPSTIRCHANHMLINPEEITLPQVLKEQGYQTAIIGKNHAFMDGRMENYYSSSREKEDILHQTFDYIVEGGHGHLVDGFRDDPEVQAAHQWAEENCFQKPLGYGTNPASFTKCGTQLLGDTAIDYLETVRNEDVPFFMWLSFPDPHTPYQVPEPYASMYDPANVPLPPKDDLNDKPERQRVAHIMDAMDKADDDVIRKVRATHYGMINFIDDNVGRVLETINHLGIKENTIIIFTSDHGDSMGAHQLIQKHNAFYDSFTHVPLIVSWPGTIQNKTGNHLIELIDLMPTLLELSNLSIPDGVQGKSFASYLLEQPYHPREYVVIESGEKGSPPEVSDITARPADPFDESCFVWCAYREAWYGRGKSIRTNDWKLNIYDNGDGELYDLKHDPAELSNLYGKTNYDSITIELERKLLRWCIDKDDVLPVNKTVHHQYKNLFAGGELGQ
ncbi:sulfatase family protein [Gracilibacillus salinarum]|uniref:Sulfatase-like hydrolase/transferase n=1 Tax=Gracilibacillus salinarum TaxID=2932255 RepID=A0ABY4GSJ6_9BACI|nr:sulfatase-like hydrolase/transferase [Gracilibacillus salinarum]UOQ86945.1 sulfatase-like hydrolase/transferase [Gracilibacillus salinarum]